MNDLHESGKIIFVDANNNPIKDISSNKLKKIVDEIYKYRQISFTIDKPKKEKLGFDLLQMWGIYADKGEGVCLVFDKEELNIKGLEYIQSQITYHKKIEPSIRMSDDINNTSNEIKKIRKSYSSEKVKNGNMNKNIEL
jgi:hypothetical protein